MQFLGKGSIRVPLDQRDLDKPMLGVGIVPGWHINSDTPLEDACMATKLYVWDKGD